MDLCQTGKGRALEQRDIACDYDYRAVATGERCPRGHNGVTGPALLGLKRKMHVWADFGVSLGQSRGFIANGAFYLFGLMPYYRKNGSGSQFEGGAKHMGDQWLAGNLMKHLGPLTLHPRAEPRRQNHNVSHYFPQHVMCCKA
jgi:hypothetical protein